LIISSCGSSPLVDPGLRGGRSAHVRPTIEAAGSKKSTYKHKQKAQTKDKTFNERAKSGENRPQKRRTIGHHMVCSSRVFE
jgi:hypothetical protein